MRVTILLPPKPHSFNQWVQKGFYKGKKKKKKEPPPQKKNKKLDYLWKLFKSG